MVELRTWYGNRKDIWSGQPNCSNNQKGLHTDMAVGRLQRAWRLKPNLERPTQLNSTQLKVVCNSTQLVELSRVGRSEHSDDPTQLNSTEQSELQSWPSFRLAMWCQHANTNIIYLITEVMYDVYKSVHVYGQEAQLSQRDRAAACLNFDKNISANSVHLTLLYVCLLYTSPSPRD